MLGFSPRSRSHPALPQRRGRVGRGTKASSFRPNLEELEPRNCPSTISLSMTPPTAGSKQVALSGQVTNTSSPGGLTVLLSGVVGGTATTDANGNFTATLTASGQGAAYAATSDGQSNIAQVAVTDPGTVIDDFGAITGTSNIFTFSGHVQGGYQGEVVNFGGLKDLEGQSATVDANGEFSLTVQLDGKTDDEGDAYAQATDAWGVQSNEASYWITQSYSSGNQLNP